MRLIPCKLVALLALASPAQACSPIPLDPEGDARRADYVLLVRVKAVQPGRVSTLESVRLAGDQPATIASYEVESQLKGEVPLDRRFAVVLPPPPRAPAEAPEMPCGDWPLPSSGERWLLYRFAAHHHTRAIPLPGQIGEAHLAWWQRHTAKP